MQSPESRRAAMRARAAYHEELGARWRGLIATLDLDCSTGHRTGSSSTTSTTREIDDGVELAGRTPCTSEDRSAADGALMDELRSMAGDASADHDTSAPPAA